MRTLRGRCVFEFTALRATSSDRSGDCSHSRETPFLTTGSGGYVGRGLHDLVALERFAPPRSGRSEGALFCNTDECPFGATATREERHNMMQTALVPVRSLAPRSEGDIPWKQIVPRPAFSSAFREVSTSETLMPSAICLIQALCQPSSKK